MCCGTAKGQRLNLPFFRLFPKLAAGQITCRRLPSNADQPNFSWWAWSRPNKLKSRVHLGQPLQLHGCTAIIAGRRKVLALEPAPCPQSCLPLLLHIKMGSCFSTNKAFQGEGRTLNEPAQPAAASASNPTSAPGGGGRRLGGASATSAAPPSGAATSDAEREARAKAAERRMNQQAAKGTPGQGKLSKQLQTQKQANPHSLADQDDQPERVVVSRQTFQYDTHPPS